MSFRISNSALDTYQTCPKKFYFQYIERWKADLTKSPLLFGTAIDSALNYILESIRDKKEWSKEEAVKLYDQGMNQWQGQNRLDFFKNEVPEELKDSYDPDNVDHQKMVWDNIYKRGIACIDVYINEVLPQLSEVLHVQHKFEIQNEEEDTFTGVIDFIGKLKDGRVVLFDNKTSSSKYPKNKVVTSQQLSLYADQFPEIEYFGYIVLIKDPAKEKGMTHQIMVDKIPEETIANAFKLLDETMANIKAGKFDCNYKSCKKFNKECEFSKLCQWNDSTGLIKNEKTKNKEIKN